MKIYNKKKVKKKPKARIPLETGFALGTQREGIGSKQHEIYMPNPSPLRWGPNTTYIPPARVGDCHWE